MCCRNASSSDCPVIEASCRIVIQRTFKKTVSLPNPAVWDYLPSSLHSCLLVRVRRSEPFFFTREPKQLPLRCVLTAKGCLIVYTKEKSQKGYAVRLKNAEYVKFSRAKAVEEGSVVTIKWSFGAITLSLYKHQISQWRSKILETFDGRPMEIEQKNRRNAETQTESVSTEIASSLGSDRMYIETITGSSTDAITPYEVMASNISPSSYNNCYGMESTASADEYELEDIKLASIAIPEENDDAQIGKWPVIKHSYLEHNATPFAAVCKRYGIGQENNEVESLHTARRKTASVSRVQMAIDMYEKLDKNTQPAKPKKAAANKVKQFPLSANQMSYVWSEETTSVSSTRSFVIGNKQASGNNNISTYQEKGQLVNGTNWTSSKFSRQLGSSANMTNSKSIRSYWQKRFTESHV